MRCATHNFTRHVVACCLSSNHARSTICLEQHAMINWPYAQAVRCMEVAQRSAGATLRVTCCPCHANQENP